MADAALVGMDFLRWSNIGLDGARMDRRSGSDTGIANMAIKHFPLFLFWLLRRFHILYSRYMFKDFFYSVEDGFKGAFWCLGKGRIIPWQVATYFVDRRRAGRHGGGTSGQTDGEQLGHVQLGVCMHWMYPSC